MPHEQPIEDVQDAVNQAILADLISAGVVAKMLRGHDVDAEADGRDVVVHLPTTEFTITQGQIARMAETADALNRMCAMPLGQAFAAQVHMVAELMKEVVADGREHLLGGSPR